MNRKCCVLFLLKWSIATRFASGMMLVYHFAQTCTCHKSTLLLVLTFTRKRTLPMFSWYTHALLQFHVVMLCTCTCMQTMVKSTRLGGPDCLHLECFTEALYNEESGLTFPALTGQCKQSVQDAENLFFNGAEEFMKRKGYTYEKFVRVVRNWRRASDERGLMSPQRSLFNYQLLNLMLDELMPWHRDTYDFRLLEVNR